MNRDQESGPLGPECQGNPLADLELIGFVLVLAGLVAGWALI